MYRKRGPEKIPVDGHGARVLGEAGILHFPLCWGQSDVA